MDKTIGTCSECGGRVTIPENWMSTVPPVPRCESCGATKKHPHGPVIDMEPSGRQKNNRWPKDKAEFLERFGTYCAVR